MLIIITINQKGARVAGIEALIEKYVKVKYPEARIAVARKEPVESRADRFAEAKSLVSAAHSQAEALRDELQEWRDGMPLNLQQGDKAQEIETAIEELGLFFNALDEADGVEVEFPGMY